MLSMVHLVWGINVLYRNFYRKATRIHANNPYRITGRKIATETQSNTGGFIMRKAPRLDLVYSKPTMCLHCHLIVEMTHEHEADPVKGAWNCPRCGHVY